MPGKSKSQVRVCSADLQPKKCMGHHVLFSKQTRGRRAQKSRRNPTRKNPILTHVPCAPGAQPCCGNSPPPGSGSEWRTAFGTGSSPLAPSPPRSLWLFRQTWLCLCLGTQGDSFGTLGNTSGTVKSIHSSHTAGETGTLKTHAAVQL